MQVILVKNYPISRTMFRQYITATSRRTTTANKAFVIKLVCSTLPLISRHPSGCMNGYGRSIPWPSVPTHCPYWKQQERSVCSADCITTPLTSRATGLRVLMQLCNTSPYTVSRGQEGQRMHWMWRFMGLLSYRSYTEDASTLYIYTGTSGGRGRVKKKDAIKDLV